MRFGGLRRSSAGFIGFSLLLGVAGCSSSPRTSAAAGSQPVHATAPVNAPSQTSIIALAGSRTWTTSATSQSGYDFKVTISVGPVQKLSAFPGDVSQLESLCAGDGQNLNPETDALVRGSIEVTNSSSVSGSPTLQFLLPSVAPVRASDGTNCFGQFQTTSDMELTFNDLGASQTASNNQLAFILVGYFDPANPSGDPAIGSQAVVQFQAGDMGATIMRTGSLSGASGASGEDFALTSNGNPACPPGSDPAACAVGAGSPTPSAATASGIPATVNGPGGSAAVLDDAGNQISTIPNGTNVQIQCTTAVQSVSELDVKLLGQNEYIASGDADTHGAVVPFC